MQKYFKIILSDRIKDSFIYLPSDVVEIINHNLAKIEDKQQSFNIIKLKLLNSEEDIFLANFGGVGSKENCIEISQYLGQCLKIKNGDYAKITDINSSEVEISESLQLEPLTHIDYKIIESNPEFFEENLLNQLLVAYANMVFPFIFPDNSVVYLKIISNKKNKPLVISQDCEVEIIYKHEDKQSDKEEDRKVFFQQITKIKSLNNLSNNFHIPILYVPKLFLENNKINFDVIGQLICQISLCKPTDLVNKEKYYYNSIFSRLCDYQSVYKYYSNTNNYQNLVEQIINKFPYYNSFWVNIKIDDEKLDCVRINEFYYKFNTVIFENDQVNFNVVNFDLKSFNFNIYNEILVKYLTIDYYFNEKDNLSLDDVEKLIQDLFTDFIQKNSFLILSNKFYFILDSESREIYHVDSQPSNTFQEKILIYINFNTNTNEFVNFLLKLGKSFNFSKYSSIYDNDKVLKSLIILNSQEIVQKLQIKFNKEVKIFCHEYFQNKLNRHVFNNDIMSIFNNNSFYSLLENNNLNFVNFHRNGFNQITQNMKNFFKNKSQIFLNFIFGQRLVGKSLLARYISNLYFSQKNKINILETENIVSFSNEIDFKIKYINLNLLGLNVKIFKKYIKSFFDIQHEMEESRIIFIIDGMNSLSSNKVNENGGGQMKEVINYLAFKILSHLKIIYKKNKLCRNRMFVMMLINSITDIPEVFKNSKFLYDIIELNFLEKTDCENILNILLKEELFFEKNQTLNKNVPSVLSEYTKCFVIEDFCKIYNSLQASEQNKKDSQTTISDILSNYTPINLDANKKIPLTNNFTNVGGLRSIKEEIYNTISLSIQFYEKFKQKPPIKLSSGILLYGPSGCGKTLLASCIQNEFKLNFFSIKGPEILNKYIGSSEARIREIFENAKKVTPCVIFFDEFDSIAPKRGSGSSGVTDRIVNQLLCYLDGIESREGVFVMAATSKPDLIDPAVLRPGRIEKILYCGFPTEEERVEILELYLHQLMKDITDDNKSAIREIAQKTENYSSADLQNIVNEAHLMAIHEIKDLEMVDKIRLSSTNLLNSFMKSKKSVVESDIQYFKKYNKNFREKIEEDTMLKMREQRTTLY